MAGHSGSFRSQLRELARVYDIQTAYTDFRGQRQRAEPEALLAVLRALGAGVETFRDVPDALRERRQALWRRICPQVCVAWQGAAPALELRLPADLQEHHTFAYRLSLENGRERSRTVRMGDLPLVGHQTVEGQRYGVRQLRLPARLAFGFHTLELEGVGARASCLVLSAPQKAYGLKEKAWGVFLPLYALHSNTSWGGGDFSDLDALVTWTAEQGGGSVATLPLLAAFLGQDGEPFEPSPYAPVSRLFWNECYLDIRRIPELHSCQAARSLLASTDVQAEVTALRHASQLDYRRQMALKRRLLEALARHFFDRPSLRQAAFAEFAAAQPELDDYARFRAAGEHFGAPWPDWPQPLRDGRIRHDAVPQERANYHRYVQWLAHEQMQAAADKARRHGSGLYLDLPLGVHGWGYDVWKQRELFVSGVSSGAPPDNFFAGGQNWGFPPLHPDTSRARAYGYVRAYLRHHLRHAGILRLDHVMGLHRLFWVPHGYDPRQGVYVGYPAEEWYAVLSLESHRSRTVLVGEDLGTVPAAVRPAMARHGILRSQVLQFAVPRRMPARAVASLNTHDSAPFAAFWQGLEGRERVECGFLELADLAQVESEHEDRRQALLAFLTQHGWLESRTLDPQAVYAACVSYLAASAAQFVLINLEDVWGETQRQNMPGTGQERPNWRRKARHGLETFSHMPRLLEIVRQVHSLRTGTRVSNGTDAGSR